MASALAGKLAAGRTQEDARRSRVQRMLRGEAGAGPQVAEHCAAETLGELDPQPPGRDLAAYPSDQD